MKARTIVLMGITGFGVLCAGAVNEGMRIDAAAITETSARAPGSTSSAAVPTIPTIAPLPVATTSPPSSTTLVAPPPSQPPVETTTTTTVATTTVAPTTAAAAPSPSFEATVTESGGLLLLGQVASEVQRLALITAAEHVAGTGAVDAGGLVVIAGDGPATDAMVANAVRVLYLLAGGFRMERLVVDGGALAVTGSVDDATSGDWLRAALEQASADGLSVANAVDLSGAGG